MSSSHAAAVQSSSSCQRTALALTLIIFIFSWTVRVQAKSYSVSPDGSGSYYTLDEALQLVKPGEYISLSDGTYTEGLNPPHGGSDGKPIQIYGGRDAVITGKNPVVNIEHSWISLKGFTVNGKFKDEEEYDSYLNKCVWVKGQGMSTNDALEGFIMKEMKVHNCGGECVRLRNFVVGAELRDNEVYDCGVYDFRFNSKGKNGEAFYIGTASELWDDDVEDECLDNLITGNVMETNGNECVDIKEGSSGNIVEHNECKNQMDEESACYDSRGDGNIFRYNIATDCIGAGVRLGGDKVKGYQFGSGNSVYENTFKRSEAGALNIQVSPQSQTCGNKCSSGPCGILGNEDDNIAETWDQPC